MPWVIGIDEAGYGPNLGPLLQAAAIARVPAFDLAGWETFTHKIRRAHEPRDSRLLIDDSKKVYRGGAGLADMEATLREWHHDSWGCAIRNRGVGQSFEDFQTECWCGGITTDVDMTYDPDGFLLMDAGLMPQSLHYVSPLRLNQIIQTYDSKAMALTRGYIHLVTSAVGWLKFLYDFPEMIDRSRHAGFLDESKEIIIIADKLGGRHYYAGLVQDVFPDYWIVTERETPGESRYRVENHDFKITAIFRPKADAGSISVALASMMAKYVRELCMQKFNAFWANHVPGIKPTAGYPGDAKRYFTEIEPALARLGIAKDAVWRIK